MYYFMKYINVDGEPSGVMWNTYHDATWPYAVQERIFALLVRCVGGEESLILKRWIFA